MSLGEERKEMSDVYGKGRMLLQAEAVEDETRGLLSQADQGMPWRCQNAPVRETSHQEVAQLFSRGQYHESGWEKSGAPASHLKAEKGERP